MIRAMAVASLLSLLVLVLYVPSAHPPERFVEQLRTEYTHAAEFWGKDAGTRMLSRAMSMQESARQASPVPSSKDAAPVGGVNAAVGQEMASVNQRLFNNPYFRSIDALLLLASFRLSMLLEWLPWLLAFPAAAMTDGYLVRLVKAKEFLHHNPEMFALHACLAILTSCATVLAFVLPITLHPLVVPCVPVVIGTLMGTAIRDFHRRA
ncbi:MAG: hypothetical protein A3E52_02990 [Burkholderiales bacterium RIFCSPHIGHO2_12_FULL_63_20]|nr:MAG: hypothetical protein A3E52_02990 [Burkholderiales bacterium RIFCSPHIGHO2_12_FULL_63_20]